MTHLQDPEIRDCLPGIARAAVLCLLGLALGATAAPADGGTLADPPGAASAPMLGATPAAPSNLRGAGLGPRRLRLAWQDNACNEITQILQLQIGGVWVDVPFDLGPDTTSLIVSGLDPDTAYSFRVVALGADGTLSYSEPVTVRTFPRGADCLVDVHRLCLLDGRFLVEVDYSLPQQPGQSLRARAIPETDRFGAFWFFDPDNLEVVVELEDEIDDLGQVGVAFGALSDLGFRVTVEDTETGEVRRWEQTARDTCARRDPNAFPKVRRPAESAIAPTWSSSPAAGERDSAPGDLGGLAFDTRPLFTGNPLPGTVTCDRDPTSLLLQDGRFAVRTYRIDSSGSERTAEAMDATANGGLFHFLGADRPAWAVKILDGRSFDGHFWLFTLPFSAVEGRIEILDLLSGKTRLVYNPPGDSCGRTSLLAAGVGGSP